MKITRFIIPSDRAGHIAKKHSVTLEEVRQAAFDDPHRIAQRLKGARAYLVTARNMTLAERRYYHAKKR